MAISSISHNPQSLWVLRLVDATQSSHIDFPLLENYRPASLDLACEGVVHESHEYRALLLHDAPLNGAAVSCSVNGEEPSIARLHLVEGHVEDHGGVKAYVHQMLFDVQPSWFPFALTYGFASIVLQVHQEQGGVAVLSTKDIACACDREDQEASVLGMIDTLVSGEDAEAVCWMLGSAQAQADRRALVEAGPLADSSKSLSSFLALCEKTVRCFDRNLSFFCTHAHARTSKSSVMVRPSQVRRLGREELLWLAGNTEVLRRTGTQTSLRIAGEYYVPAQVRTQRPRKCFDTRENRALLAFANEVAVVLTRVLALLEEDMARLNAMVARLKQLRGASDSGLVPALLVMESCLQRELPLLEKAHRLRQSVRGMHQALKRALPGVAEATYRLPRRTKPFQEIPAYAALHACMRSWDAFGEFQMQRDGLVLHTWKMDKLYEYYVLYELLSSLHMKGFKPDPLAENPIEQAEYSLDSRYFANEEQVATVYRLVRGEERIALYYQPVIYGDEREEHGISLHRTTLTQAGFDSYWTPDYLLVHEMHGVSETILLDAKFRKVSAVSFAGPANDAKSCMLECLRKYKLETCDAQGRAVDSLWLFCGRAFDRYAEPLQQSSWAQCQSIIPDGIATVAPDANALDVFFDAVGIAEEAEA